MPLQNKESGNLMSCYIGRGGFECLESLELPLFCAFYGVKRSVVMGIG